MRMQLVCKLLVFFCVSELYLTPALAGLGIVDQEHIALTHPGSQANFVSLHDQGIAQTFTVGRTGVLSAVEVGLIRESDTESVIFADIRKVVNNVPDFSPGGVLASRSMSSRLLPIEVYPGIYVSKFTATIDFSTDNLQVVAGDKLALHLRSNGVETFPGSRLEFPLWWIDAPSMGAPKGYAGGEAYSPMSSTIVVPPLPPGIYPYYDDVHFRTFVVVPEPTSTCLSIAFVASIVSLSRSRSALP